MIGTILVPLDGSRFAELALPVALDLARRSGAALRLLMVHEPQLAPVPAEVPQAWTGLSEPDRREHELEYLEGLAGDIVVRGKPARYDLLDGTAAATLTEAITLAAPDFVVMATHGRGPFSRFWLGSVADYVVRHLPVPVLLIRPVNGIGRQASGLGCRNILVPLDLSVESEAILEPVKVLARLSDAQLTLTYVVDSGGHRLSYPLPSGRDPERLESERAEAAERLEEIAAGLRREGFDVATRVLTGAGVASQLLELFQHGRFDLLALTTHGTGGLQRAMLGSVADKLIRGAEKPILLMRPEGSPA